MGGPPVPDDARDAEHLLRAHPYIDLLVHGEGEQPFLDLLEAWPETVSVSYNEAGRWLDAQERVDNVPLAAPVAAWLQAYTDAHYRPEPKKRRRPQSFVAPSERS